MVGVPAAIFITAEVGVIHQANIAHLRTVNDDQIALVQNFPSVDKLHFQIP